MVLICTGPDLRPRQKALHFGEHSVSHPDLYSKHHHMPQRAALPCTRGCATEPPRGVRAHLHHCFTTQQAQVPIGEMIYP